jgi:carbonic anhydrase
MSVLPEVLKSNASYAATFGAKSKLTIPPARHFTILTCMDARLDPAKYAGLAEGDAHVIRNAGGRASNDALRSLVISYKLLGTNEFFVIHHTDCGMLRRFKGSSQRCRVQQIVIDRRELRLDSSS